MVELKAWKDASLSRIDSLRNGGSETELCRFPRLALTSEALLSTTGNT